MVKEFCVVFKRVKDRKYPILIRNGEDFNIDLCNESSIWDTIKEYKDNGYEQVYPRSFFYRRADRWKKDVEEDINRLPYTPIHYWNGECIDSSLSEKEILANCSMTNYVIDTIEWWERSKEDAQKEIEKSKLKLCSWWTGYEDIEAVLRFYESAIKRKKAGE